MLWIFCFFFYVIYIFTVFFVIFYLLPLIKDLTLFQKHKTTSAFVYVTGFDVYWILLTPLYLLMLMLFSWSSPSLLAWFGSIIFTNFQIKASFLTLFTFFSVITIYVTSFYFSSREIYDYLLVCFNFFFWIFFLFYANTFFTVVFFIEILSTLIFLLLITSTFSTTYYYNNLNLNLHNYFSPTTPLFYLQMLLYFFWISLISSLNLFFFLILFYLQFLTFDWFLFEFVFNYVANSLDLKGLFSILVIWLNLLFCIFLKCGLVPFYFWKPVFFKGIPLHALMFYVTFFYFFIFLFFIYFFLIYTNEIFYYFIFINFLLLVAGILFLLIILCEAYYIKVFFAMSSILNTLFVFLALSGANFTDFIFFL